MKHNVQVTKRERIKRIVTKPFHSKKAFNDMHLMFSIMGLFILVGFFLPYVDDAFSTNQVNSNNVGGLQSNVGQDQTITSINSITIIGSIFKMFFWTFGSLPFWLDIFFVPLRIIFAVTLARNIWIGGGA